VNRSAITAFLAGLALAALLALVVFDRLSARDARAAASSLVEAHHQIDSLKKENIRLGLVLSSLTNLSMPPNTDALEIDRLKAEIASLRSQIKTSAPIVTNLVLNPSNAAQAYAQAAAAADDQSAVLPGLPQTAWQFSGYDTAEDAFESLVWAMKNGDVDTFRASLTPEAQQTMDRAFTGMSPTAIGLELQNEVSALPYLPVDRAIQLPDGDVSFIIFAAQSDDGGIPSSARAVITFRNIDGVWKSTGLY